MISKWLLISILALPVASQSEEATPASPNSPKPVEAPQKKANTYPAFELKLSIKNGHLGQVFLKTDPKGTDKYDRGLDDMAPPPGMQTGYTALVSPDMKHYLYRDTRKTAKEISWIFFAEVFNNKPVTVSWNKALIPAAYDFTLEDANNEQTLNMREVEAYTLKEKSAFYIKAKLKESKPKSAVETPKKEKEPIKND